MPSHEIADKIIDSSTDKVCDIEKFLTEEAKAREEHALRSLAPLLKIPGIIFLGGGIPTGAVFPFKALKLTLTDGQEIDLTPHEMCEMQQYGMTDKGYPPLVTWVEEHMEKLHAPPTPHPVLMSCGNTNGTDLVLRTLLSRGEAVLVEEYTYSSALQAMRPLGIELVSMPTDCSGPIPEAIRSIFAERKKSGKPLPKVLYAVPVSCNPTGISWSDERKRQIYDIACEFDFMIFDDDAYFYLQYPHSPTSDAPGLYGLGKSLLSMDTQGRVVRTDTFSKFLAPGFRLGWVSAPPLLLEKMLRTFQCSVQGASNMTNLTVSRLLHLWGEKGLDEHLKMVQKEYARRAAALVAAAERHLTGVATWTQPTAGMFLWLKLGPMIEDAATLQPAMKTLKVAVVPGRVFSAKGTASPYFRVSFASASDSDMNDGMERLGALLRGYGNGELQG